MLFDSHAHLDDNRFDNDRTETIERVFASGISGILNAGACMASSAQSVVLAEQYPLIYAAVGIHPHSAKDACEKDYSQLLAWSRHAKVVAIGEIGLDYYHNLSPRDVQQTVFIRQIDIARQAGLPIIIHDRDAHGDITRIIKEHAPGVIGVLHCFSGSMEMARDFLKLGFYLSIAGPVTFKNAAKLLDIVKEVPLERLLIETDCPYLTPEPYRGRRNDPTHVRLVAEKIAELRGVDLETIAKATAANARRLFGIV